MDIEKTSWRILRRRVNGDIPGTMNGLNQSWLIKERVLFEKS